MRLLLALNFFILTSCGAAPCSQPGCSTFPTARVVTVGECRRLPGYKPYLVKVQQTGAVDYLGVKDQPVECQNVFTNDALELLLQVTPEQ